MGIDFITPTALEINLNLNAVENKIAQQWLEGHKSSHEVISDLERIAHCQISIDEAIVNILQNVFEYSVMIG